MLRTSVVLAALACTGSAVAQTSNCMNIGGGMVHCDSIGPNGSSSSTDCTSIGGGMATCNTTGTAQPTPDISRPQTNGTALNAIGDLIARSQERTFQSRISEMLAAGDCHGAANLALAHQRFDLSNQIRRSCVANQTPDAISAEQFMAGQPLPPGGVMQSQGSRQLPAAFDLWCEGKQTEFTKEGPLETVFTRIFRIDLASGRYCDGDCTSTRAIFRVEDNKITFFDSFSQSGLGSEQSVNRETGELFEGRIGVDATTLSFGQCERRPFSGFPQRQF